MFDTLTPTFVVLIAIGAACGGFINGLAGFGTALFSLGFFLTVLPPEQAVAVVVAMSVVTGLQGIWVVRDTIWAEPVRLSRFLVPGLFGIPLGIATLSVVNAEMLKLGVATFLILYGGYFSVRRSLPRMSKPTHLADITIGFIGGWLGGTAALSGALPTMWCNMKAWSKAEVRAVLQPYNLIVLLITAVLLAVRGAYTSEVLAALIVALPVGMLAARLGIFTYKRLSDDGFQRLLVSLCLISGTVLAVRSLI